MRDCLISVSFENPALRVLRAGFLQDGFFQAVVDASFGVCDFFFAGGPRSEFRAVASVVSGSFRQCLGEQPALAGVRTQSTVTFSRPELSCSSRHRARNPFAGHECYMRPAFSQPDSGQSATA